MEQSDSEGYDLADHSWSEVTRGGGRGRRRGRAGSAAGGQQARLMEMPGALGLITGDRARQAHQQQQTSNTNNREPQRYPKAVSARAGFRHINTCVINLNNVKVGPTNGPPTDIDINVFLLTKCGIKQEDLVRACSMRNRQQFWVSFKTELLANDFERKLLSGIDYGNGNIVTGRRLDIPGTHIRVRGVACDVKRETVTRILSKYGVVSSCTRGTAPMSRQYKEGDPKWVWDGVWNVLLKPKENITVPSYIVCDDDSWQLEFPGASRLCWKCLRSHPFWKCPARDRRPEDGEVLLEPEMAPNVDKVDLEREEEQNGITLTQPVPPEHQPESNIPGTSKTNNSNNISN